MAEVTTEDESSVKVYARVRQIMPWENERLGIKWSKTTITNYGLNNASKDYNFTQALGPELDNATVFSTVVSPLVNRVLQGYNSLIIAYGQTGAGKTYTLLGKQNLGVTGMLTQSLIEFINNEDVKEIKLRAVEAYGVTPAKIRLFDLLSDENHTGNWSEKVGNSRLQIEGDQVSTKVVKTKDDCYEIIRLAQEASHFAPTGKNPESSRGHIVFVIDVKGENSDNEEISSSMVFADLAGSEGDSALTEEFAATVSEETLMARKLEGGVINVGLSELQLIFRDLMTKGKLSRSTGTGLVRMIKPYINQNTFISVVFCLSPSFVNCSSTEATLKFAAQACKLKTAPAKCERRINYEHMASRLKEEIEEKDGLISKLQTVITEAMESDSAIYDLLHEKLNTVDCLDLFQVHKPEPKKSLGEEPPVQISRKRIVSVDLRSRQSQAMTTLKSIEEEEDTWQVSRKNKKHHRMFSRHIEHDQMLEIPSVPSHTKFTPVRDDHKIVEEVMKDAEEDEHSRSWLAAMSSSLYMANTINPLFGISYGAQHLFHKIAEKLFHHSTRHHKDAMLTQSLKEQSSASLTDLDFSKLESDGTGVMGGSVIITPSGPPKEDDSMQKEFHRVTTEDVLKFHAVD